MRIDQAGYVAREMFVRSFWVILFIFVVICVYFPCINSIFEFFCLVYTYNSMIGNVRSSHFSYTKINRYPSTNCGIMLIGLK